MPVTVEKIKTAAQVVRDMGRIRAGCIWFEPAVEVIRVGTGEVLHVRGMDETGMFPGTVFVVEELGWNNANLFDLPVVPLAAK